MSNVLSASPKLYLYLLPFENINNEHVINAFKFHLNCNNHVVMFHTYKDNNCLLLCKVKDKFINIIIPFVNGVRLLQKVL